MTEAQRIAFHQVSSEAEFPQVSESLQDPICPVVVSLIIQESVASPALDQSRSSLSFEHIIHFFEVQNFSLVQGFCPP